MIMNKKWQLFPNDLAKKVSLFIKKIISTKIQITYPSVFESFSVHVFALLFVGLLAGGLLTIISIAASKPHLLFGSETECKIEALPLNQNITETFNCQVILEESRDASLKIEATTEDLLLLDFETGEEQIKNLEHELDTCKKDLKEKKFEESKIS